MTTFTLYKTAAVTQTGRGDPFTDIELSPVRKTHAAAEETYTTRQASTRALMAFIDAFQFIDPAQTPLTQPTHNPTDVYVDVQDLNHEQVAKDAKSLLSKLEIAIRCKLVTKEQVRNQWNAVINDETVSPIIIDPRTIQDPPPRTPAEKLAATGKAVKSAVSTFVRDPLTTTQSVAQAGINVAFAGFHELTSINELVDIVKRCTGKPVPAHEHKDLWERLQQSLHRILVEAPADAFRESPHTGDAKAAQKSADSTLILAKVYAVVAGILVWRNAVAVEHGMDACPTSTYEAEAASQVNGAAPFYDLLKQTSNVTAPMSTYLGTLPDTQQTAIIDILTQIGMDAATPIANVLKFFADLTTSLAGSLQLTCLQTFASDNPSELTPKRAELAAHILKITFGVGVALTAGYYFAKNYMNPAVTAADVFGEQSPEAAQFNTLRAEIRGKSTLKKMAQKVKDKAEAVGEGATDHCPAAVTRIQARIRGWKAEDSTLFPPLAQHFSTITPLSTVAQIKAACQTAGLCDPYGVEPDNLAHNIHSLLNPEPATTHRVTTMDAVHAALGISPTDYAELQLMEARMKSAGTEWASENQLQNMAVKGFDYLTRLVGVPLSIIAEKFVPFQVNALNGYHNQLVGMFSMAIQHRGIDAAKEVIEVMSEMAKNGNTYAKKSAAEALVQVILACDGHPHLSELADLALTKLKEAYNVPKGFSTSSKWVNQVTGALNLMDHYAIDSQYHQVRKDDPSWTERIIPAIAANIDRVRSSSALLIWALGDQATDAMSAALLGDDSEAVASQIKANLLNIAAIFLVANSTPDEVIGARPKDYSAEYLSRRFSTPPTRQAWVAEQDV